MPGHPTPLLILDLDETLVYAVDSPARGAVDFRCGHYDVRLRPGVRPFLTRMSEFYQLAVWTASTGPYAQCIVDAVFEGYSLEFVWSRARCTRKYDPSLHQEYYVKDLRKVKRRGYCLDGVLMVDNTPRKLERNYGNLVRVSSWEGCPEDQELYGLTDYLLDLRDEPNYRTIEKRGWQRRFGVSAAKELDRTTVRGE